MKWPIPKLFAVAKLVVDHTTGVRLAVLHDMRASQAEEKDFKKYVRALKNG